MWNQGSLADAMLCKSDNTVCIRNSYSLWHVDYDLQSLRYQISIMWMTEWSVTDMVWSRHQRHILTDFEVLFSMLCPSVDFAVCFWRSSLLKSVRFAVLFTMVDYRVAQKSKPQTFVYVFAKYWPISIFFTGAFCGKCVIKWLLIKHTTTS